MERLVDLVLLPISLFSGKTLAVSIALTILGWALLLWMLIHFRIERKFLSVYNDLSRAVNLVRKSGNTAERDIAKVVGTFKKSVLADSWEQYSACLDYSNGHAFNHADPAPYFASDRVPGHNYVKW